MCSSHECIVYIEEPVQRFLRWTESPLPSTAAINMTLMPPGLPLSDTVLTSAPLECARSWWALRFDLDTPLPGLEGTASRGLALLLSVAQAARRSQPAGSEAEATQHSPIWDMALRCCWSLSTSHPVRGQGNAVIVVCCGSHSLVVGAQICAQLHELVLRPSATCE